MGFIGKVEARCVLDGFSKFSLFTIGLLVLVLLAGAGETAWRFFCEGTVRDWARPRLSCSGNLSNSCFALVSGCLHQGVTFEDLPQASGYIDRQPCFSSPA